MPKYGQILWAGEMQTLIATTTSDQQVLGKVFSSLFYLFIFIIDQVWVSLSNF